MILRSRGLTQTDLFTTNDSPFKNIGQDRINKLVLEKQKNYTIETAKMISKYTWGKIDDIVD